MISTEWAKQILERVFRDHPTKNFAIRLWDGTEIRWTATADFTLIFRDANTFQSLMRSNDVSLFGKAYVEDQFDIEGDIYAAITLGRYLRTVKIGIFERLRLAAKLGVPTTRHTREDDARDVQAHYDLSNEFYRLFLDERMVYSCAYFETPTSALEQAQERKLDLICRKLRLQPGETFLDVGCGWGALVMWAAQRYGVKAHGITLSQQQYDLATQKIREAGLQDQITIELKHYMDLPEGAYDKIASIGMIEHVGIPKYPDYFGKLFRALKPGGLLLNHGITVPVRNGGRVGGEFIFTYVFPGADLDTISHTQTIMEQEKFEILDVEELRPHYALTLREWMKRFSEHEEEAAKYVPKRIMRVWNLYLPGCALAFEHADIGVHQVLAAKNDPQGKNQAPLTREDIHRSPLASHEK